jgi:hypothetical protein
MQDETTEDRSVRRRCRRTTIALQDRLRRSKRRNDRHLGQRKPSAAIRMLRRPRPDPPKHSALRNLYLIPRRIQMQAVLMEARSSRIVITENRRIADLVVSSTWTRPPSAGFSWLHRRLAEPLFNVVPQA